jgi:hypothetical protein
MLNEIRRILNQNGMLFIIVSHYSSPLVRSTSWLGWFPQEHFWHFDRKTLVALLEQHGFELKHLTYPMHTDFVSNTGSFGVTKRVAKNILKSL